MLSLILNLRVCQATKQIVKTRFQLSQNSIKTQFRRMHTSNASFGNYEGDGKTIVTILNREHSHLIMFDAYSKFGFRLNNGMFVFGPMAVFPKSVLQWTVQTVEDITPETLSLFSLLEPKLDILIIGTGDKRENLSPEALKFLKSKHIFVEVLATEKACSTFNFLNAEGRCIAGAVFPPSKAVRFREEFTLLGDHENLEALIPKQDVPGVM